MNGQRLAWLFLAPDGSLPEPPHPSVAVGQTLTARGALALGTNGVHAAVRLIDALVDAPGTILCRVRLGDETIAGTTPVRPDYWDISGTAVLYGREATVLAMADATTMLHAFACWCAERALHRERAQGREPNPSAWAAVAAKRAWLRAEITDTDLKAAMYAATNTWWGAVDNEAFATAAATGAAFRAAGDNAPFAARDAASEVADAAKEAGGGAGTGDEELVQVTERAAQNERLEAMAAALLGLAADNGTPLRP